MGDFGADTLRDSIESAWSLTGRVNNVTTDADKEIVHFFAHPQVVGAGEWTKAVEVRKINTAEDENETVHSNFSEIRDRFTITCRYRILGIDEDLFDQAEQDIEDMTEEVKRIIKTVYHPSTGTGNFWTSNFQWRNEDDLVGGKEVRRVLELTLTRLKSREPTVYQGYGGVLTFDLSASSNMNAPPAGDYIYTEVENVTHNEGNRIHSVVTRNSSSIEGGKPVKFRGMIYGNFSADLLVKKDDFGTTAEKLDKLHKAQTNGELITAAFLHATTSTEAVPTTLTVSAIVMISNMRRTSSDEEIDTWRITGEMTTLSTEAVV